MKMNGEKVINASKQDVWDALNNPDKLKLAIPGAESVEKNDDNKLIWRKHVNDQLKKGYKKLYSKLDCLLFLRAENINQFTMLRKHKDNWKC